MVFLRSTVIIFLFVFAFSDLSFSQASGKIYTAFKESHGHEAKKNYTKAVESLLKVYDDSYEMNMRIGWLYYNAKNYKESVKYYEKAVAQMSYSIEAKFGLVNPLAELGEWVKVAKQYYDILKIDPQNSIVNYRLGLILFYKPDYELAYKLFEKVVNLYPFDYDGLLMFAWTNYYLGKFREAKILFNKVLLLSPDDSSALKGLKLIK
jgi:tetratricopeptide (TPR) repeat protein